ncbi:MAG: hypothetical protein JXA42_20605 [Anaerolineales bacterium]|nr:hypothetical protein [Anaerolineales bacterium]
MTFPTFSFGFYWGDVLDSLFIGAELDLDGIDGFFDQTIAGMKVGDQISFVVNAFSRSTWKAVQKRSKDMALD